MAVKDLWFGSTRIHFGPSTVGLHVRRVVHVLLFFALFTSCAMGQPVQDAVPEPVAEVGQDPSGEWREQNRAGYRAQPTPHSVAFYRYIMDRTGRGENISTVEALLIRRMIANRTWPEAPEITARARAIQEWALRQPEEADLFTDPENWSRGLVSDAVYEQLVAAGLTDADTPHTEASERFRRYWHSLTPEQQAALPLGRWMRSYFARLGHDMRSDEQRLQDQAFAREQARLRAAGLEQQAEAERQRKEAEEAEERQRQKWFEDNWAEEDRRIEREQTELDRVWAEFITAFIELDPEQRDHTLDEMTAEQRDALARRLSALGADGSESGDAAGEPDAASPVSAVTVDVGVTDPFTSPALQSGHHAGPPTGTAAGRTSSRPGGGAAIQILTPTDGGESPALTPGATPESAPPGTLGAPTGVVESWMPPKKTGELAIGLMGAIENPDFAESLLYRHLGEVRGLDYVLLAGDRYEVFPLLGRVRASGSPLQSLLIAGHGDPDVPGIQISGATDVLHSEMVNRDLLLRAHGTYTERRRELGAELCMLRHASASDPDAALRMTTLSNQLTRASEVLTYSERLLSAIDAAWGSVAPDGLVVLLNCFAAMDDPHLQFTRNLGRILFGAESGYMMASTTKINIMEITDFGFLWQLWGRFTEGYWKGPGETTVWGNWERLQIPAQATPEPGSTVIPVRFHDTCIAVEEGTPLLLQPEVSALGDSGALAFQWGGGCDGSGTGLPTCEIRTEGQGGQMLSALVTVTDGRGRKGSDSVSVWVEPVPLRIMIELDPPQPAPGGMVRARATLLRGDAPPDSIWLWRAKGSIGLSANSGELVDAKVDGQGVIELALFGYGPFGKEKIYASATVEVIPRQAHAVPTPEPTATATETDQMRAFSVVVPSIWSGASDARAFHVRRESASGGAIYEMCPYPASVYGEVQGKVDPSFGPRSLDEIRQKLEEEAVEHRKWGREPEIRPFAIGPFQGFLLETRMRFARGGWSHSGYRDSGTEALGHGWVTLEGRTFEVSYGIGSGGCWDNSQRPFQESQTLAALREAQAILAALRLVSEPGVTQVPYSGPKLDGSDLPVVRLDPPELGRLNVGDTIIVRAVVENLSPDDRPLRFEWTGEHEGAGGEVLVRATEPGTFTLAVAVEGAKYTLGSASLTYEVSRLQVRAERDPPSTTGPVAAGAEVPLRAVLTADGQPATGEFVYRWQPDPEVPFDEQDGTTGTVTARFSEPGRYLVWVQVLRRKGDVLSTVIQSEQMEIVVENLAASSSDTAVSEGRPFTGTSPVPADSCWHSLNPDPRGWTPMPMAPLHPTTRVTPGNYVVLVGPSGISGKQVPESWRSFGPFRIEAGHTYGATIKDTGDRLVWEQDPSILESFATADRSDPSAYIYVRNDAFLVDYWHAICVLPAASTTDATVDGHWHVEFEYLGAHYPHDMRLTSTDGGALGGSGGHPAGGPHTFGWEILGGTRQGDNIEFTARYTSGAPGTTMDVRGNIAADGSMSGTWTDNYLGQARQGTWTGRRMPEPTASREETMPIPVVSCTSTGQVCAPDHTASLEGSGEVWISYTAGDRHCADVAVRIRVDDLPVQETGFVSAGQTTAALRFTLADTVTHRLTVTGLGREGGCNTGALLGWTGSLTVRWATPGAGVTGVDPAGAMSGTASTQATNLTTLPESGRPEAIAGTPPLVRLAGSELPSERLQFGRVLTGATSGRQYFGYTGGQVVLPHREGGRLHFVFWNDQHANPGPTVNRLTIQVGETVVHTVEQYSTALDLQERYREVPDWGPGGGTVVSVPVPPGVEAVVFNWQGSQTGVGLSDLRFESGDTSGSAPTVVPYVNRTTEVQPQFARVLTGATSGRQYHGHSGGQVVLPHREGGTLQFVFWNDQHANPGSTVNQLNVRVGETVHSLEQYSTALDLQERFHEVPDWGPGGGTGVSVPIPPGVATVIFDNQGSQTGIELSDLRFDSGDAPGSVPTVVPHVNRTTEVQPLFARVLTGATSGRQYHGHSGGQIVLPHREGGLLSFQLWNDQHEQTERTSNQVTVSIGEERRVIPLTTTRQQLVERYREFADWGPAGGEHIEILVPVGIGVVGFDGSGSQTGIEFSGFALHPR
jgi:hypothetical protein